MILIQLHNLYQAAHSAFEQGKWSEARRQVEALLNLQPYYSDAWHLLGLIAYQYQNTELAINSVQQAIHINPVNPLFYNSLAIMYINSQQITQAYDAFQKSLDLNPDDTDTLCNFANLLSENRQFKQAAFIYEKALQINPVEPSVCFHYALNLRELNELELAERFLKRSLLVMPEQANAHIALAEIYYQQKRFQEALIYLNKPQTNQLHQALELKGLILKSRNQNTEAINYLQQAFALCPNNVNYQLNLASCLIEANRSGKIDQRELSFAIHLLKSLLYKQIKWPEVYYNLGCGRLLQHEYSDAMQAFQDTLLLKPDHMDAHMNLWISYLEQGQLDNCIEACRILLRSYPNHANIHCYLAKALLLKGDLQEGFEEYEWRLIEEVALHVSGIKWQGQDLNHKTLLIVSEQGFGDMIQFIRYIPVIEAKWPNVNLIVEFPVELQRLINFLAIDIEQSLKENRKQLEYDYFAPLLSLPLMLAATSMNWHFPYLKLADPNPFPLSKNSSSTPKIGCVWKSSKQGKTHYKRSIPFEQFQSMFSSSNIQWYSLQFELNQLEKEFIQNAAHIIDLSSSIQDFLDSAYLLRDLDLIITVDTAIAHLAGALNKPVWLMLAYAPDWRWQLSGSSTQWYPSMRLFRQKKSHQWEDVIDDVLKALSELEFIS